VLALLGEHLSHAEIAARLFISVRTVESHVASLRRKLGLAGHRELIRLAAGYRAAVAERAPASAARLPSPLTSFIGRDSERAALAAALGESRLVSLIGPGGIGKTRLALAVAADMADRFPGGIWCADLVLVAEAAMLPAAVMTAIGLSESSSRSAEDVLAAGVRDRRALLVLDNCEHLVNSVAALTERLLSAGPDLVVLVTSRIRLVVPHETVYIVPGLSVPPDESDGGDAVALFAVRAAAAGAALGAGGDRRRVAGICRTLDGVPLAIELAAARLPSLGLDGLEAGLADQLSLLAGGSLREERDLGGAGLLAPGALAGQWDRVLALGDQFRRGWEQAGQPVAPGRALGPAAVAMVHGLRGDGSGRTQWLAILAAIRGVDQDQASRGCGYGEAFEAIVLLHRGQPDAALDLLSPAGDGSRSWHLLLWHQWIAALRAEAAVLTRDPSAARYLAQAKASADGNPIAGALTQRAEALLRADHAGLLAAAAAFARASYPYQQARTLILADGSQRATGQGQLAAMGATPMAASR